MEDDLSAAGDLDSHADDASTCADDASFAVVRQEVRMMNVVRTFVFALMITMATIAGEVLFVVLTFQEESHFANELEHYATEMIAGFLDTLQQRRLTAESLSTSLHYQAKDMPVEWPFVTFSEFDERVASSQQLAQAASIHYAPLVTPQTRQFWEAYAGYVSGRQEDEEQAQGLISRSSSSNGNYSTAEQEGELQQQPQDQTVFYVETNRTILDGIFRIENGQAITLEEENNASHPILFPLWQLSPPVEEEIRLFDQMSTPVRAQALATQTTAWSDFLFLDTNRTDYAYYTTPRTTLYSPILANGDDKKDAVVEPVVATIGMEFAWDALLQGILPVDEEKASNVVVVVESSCGRAFSFEVKGSHVSFMGAGDLSTDPSTFSAPPSTNSTYEQFATLMDYDDDPNTNTTSTSTSDNNATNATHATSPDFCYFRIRVCATKELRDSYLTYTPAAARWIVLGVFIATISVFIVYDCAVERRSNRVVETAKRTDRLVSNLFPSSVKNRLLENAAQQRKQEKRDKKKRRKKKAHWEFEQEAAPRSLLNGDYNSSDDDCDEEEERSAPRSLPALGLLAPVIHTPKRRLKSFLHPGNGIEGLVDINDSEPIADLFPNASVMFADIAGFTAWSSERDPSQVFRLLETLYRSMDKAARRFRVFKVETIGDCYVAATGLPDPREDHLEALVRFARTSLLRTTELARALEATLGPGTAELALRFGIHSGPVTAGVLRGEKARFQLFGDTMNFAARMESTGVKNKIHLSEASADLLKKRGKAHWVIPRDEKVHAKGKGELQTFWLQIGQSSASVASVMSNSSCGDSSIESNDLSAEEMRHLRRGSKRAPSVSMSVMSMGGPEQVLVGVIGETKLNRALDRLVEWNTGALSTLLKRVVASRSPTLIPGNAPTMEPRMGKARSFIGELGMAVPLPVYNAEAVARAHHDDVTLPQVVVAELRFYVSAIASGYRKNSFHNFEHASHVILSATKLLKRIAYADGHNNNEEGITTLDLHNFTYGISSDPLTQFAVVFAALIHDVGHEGVPNGQMAKELPDVAALYNNKSVAEQRSVDVALELLMLPKYSHLRECICATESELKRFRQLLIHCVLATDIFEKDLKAKRNLMWDLTFHPNGFKKDEEEKAPMARRMSKSFTQDDMNTKATIVLEHVIQASDVSHCMQHWHVYIKWNERLFEEMYAAYRAGRSDKDPSEGWYKGELWFYDNYIIPLAKKLKECGVFGVSSDEYLTYAEMNRAEWEQRGEELCKQMRKRVEESYAEKEARKDLRRISMVAEEDEEGDNESLYHQVMRSRNDLDDGGDDDDNMQGSRRSYSEH